MPAPDDQRLQREIEKQAERMARAERERPTLLAQTVFLGTLALLFVVPLVGGTYLGHWIDSAQPGYSVRWTMIGMVAGLLLGAVNVYVYIRNH
jgi:ATP synthase protein I